MIGRVTTMSGSRASARLAERKRKKREWEKLLAASSFQNGGRYDGGIDMIDHSGSVRRCGQCVFDQVRVPKTNRVRRCRVRSCVDALCWLHLRKQRQLRVKPSTLPGMAAGSNKGLFTEKEITVPRKSKNAWKIRYDGFYVDRDVSERKDYRSDYLATVRGKNYNVDAKMSNASAARYINACRPDQKAAKLCNNNMTLYPGVNGHPYARPIRRIPAGSELFMAYGASYWKPDSPVKPKSKRASRNYDLDPSIPKGKRERD